tara:strand:+ start:1759 stop:4728 length:2970 start_codon:yes stop_codon:yes gene_type:complete
MSIKFIKSTIVASALMLFATSGSAYSAELNFNGFSGTANHTVSSGFSMRVAGYNCNLYTGWKYTESTGSLTGITSVQSGNGEGCNSGAFRTDAYGNTSSKYISAVGSRPNGDDGSLNFEDGDIFSAKQKIFGSISGQTTDGGIGVDISYGAFYDPALDINSPRFKALTNSAEDEFESGFDLYDAYVTGSSDTADGGFVDYQVGRFVTNWGEATFIPVGANGLVTNAIDLTKLQGPGAAIREALIPTEAISLSTMADGVGVEVYYQLNSQAVAVPVAGSYFGSEVVGKGGDQLIVAANSMERAGNPGCAYNVQVTAGDNACTATTVTNSLANANSVVQLLDDAFTALSVADLAGITARTAGQAVAAGKQWGSAAGDNNLGGDLIDNSVLIAANAHTTASTQTPAGQSLTQATAAQFQSGMATVSARTADSTRNLGGVYINADAHKHVYAEDGGEYGVRISTYLDDVGSGVDLNFYAANYHSKAPYLRIKGTANVLAGDYYGLYTAAVTDSLDIGDAGWDGAFTGNAGGQALIKALEDTGYGSTICSAVVAGAVGAATLGAAGVTTSAGVALTKYNITDQQKALYMDRTFGTDLSAAGEKVLIHNSTNCKVLMDNLDLASGLGGTANDVNLAALGTGAIVLAAITPINQASYQFIYPEDNKIVGASFSTNAGSTTVQGEVAYRMDFPLATSGGSQVNQMMDANGGTQMLNWLAFTGLNGLGTNTSRGGNNDAADATGDLLQAGLFTQYGTVNATAGSANAYANGLRDFKRSSLPAITDTTSDYYSTPFIRKDVLSFDIGTTTSFPASHPVTKGLGADSSVLLTELAMVHIEDLSNVGGYVARGGMSESGDDPSKCLGAFGTSYTLGADKSIASIGASIVDGLFGNGGYCEGQPGADATSYSYRIIGSATYNNFGNSAWSFSPNFAWSHDPNGYGPSSLGGFVEDRMALSLGANLSKGGTTASFGYVNQLGDPEANQRTDRDYITVNISHAF